MLILRALLAAAAAVLLAHALLGPPEGPRLGLPFEGALRSVLIHPYRTGLALACVWVALRGRSLPRQGRDYPQLPGSATRLPSPLGPD